MTQSKKRVFCSRLCANKHRIGVHYKINGIPSMTTTQQRHKILVNKFGIKHCMIEGCKYSRSYNIHRFVFGKFGGKYEIGNMFII